MPSNKIPTDDENDDPNSAVTYPEEDGSDVNRGSGFWSVPTIASTVADSDQSTKTERSEVGVEGLKTLVEYPVESNHRKILENELRWYVQDKQTLYPKLVAVEAAIRKYEEVLATSGNNDNNDDKDRISVAVKAITDTMYKHRLRIDAAPYPCGDGDGVRYHWTMFMGGVGVGGEGEQEECLVVGRGDVGSEDELYSSAIFAGKRRSLELAGVPF